jgi:micrococcal nuclease
MHLGQDRMLGLRYRLVKLSGTKARIPVHGGLFSVVVLGLLLAGLVACEGGTFPPPPDPPDGVVAQVVDVVDGDTIKVSMEGEVYTVRYIGIDAPETKDPNRPVEWMGPEASAANERLVGGKMVYLEKDVSESDRYGRLLRYVYLGDGSFVNATLVRQGYAVASSYPPDVKHQDLLRQAEQEAREAERGLWSATPSPTSSAAGQPQATPAAGSMVVIVAIHHDGQIDPGEPDEYAEIRNEGNSAVNLAGWRLNAGAQGQDFRFPDFLLAPGQACRVYTDEVHPEYCGFSFGSAQALWSNDGDCGFLYDAGGAAVSRRCYE